MDARGGSNGEGRDDRIPPDQEGPRLARGRGAGRGGSGGNDPLLMAVPKGSGESDLIGAERPGATPEGLDQSTTFPGWADAAPGSNGPVICKFLRSIGPDGKLFDPRGEAVPTHRCAAFGDPLPLSLRQQELVCLQRVHVSCPRHMRGTLLAEESAAAAAEKETHSGMPYLTIAGLALVAVAGVVAIAGMMGVLPGFKGGGSHPGSSSPVAAVTASATPTAGPTLTAVPTAPPTPEPTPTATPAASPSPSPTPGAHAGRLRHVAARRDRVPDESAGAVSGSGQLLHLHRQRAGSERKRIQGRGHSPGHRAVLRGQPEQDLRDEPGRVLGHPPRREARRFRRRLADPLRERPDRPERPATLAGSGNLIGAPTRTAGAAATGYRAGRALWHWRRRRLERAR